MNQGSIQKGSKPARAAGRLPPSLALLGVRIDRSGDAARLYQQLREAIRSAIIAGEVGPGQRLPSSREMSAALQVNRATVMRAYQELAADGLVESLGSGGTAVLRVDEDAIAPPVAASGDVQPAWLLALPALGDGGLRSDPTLLRDIVGQSRRPGTISFAAGAPGVDLIPRVAIERALGSGLQRWGAENLGYAPVEGLDALRDALRRTLAAPLLRPGESVMVVSGATQGLSLAAQALIEPGDEVVVEAPTHIGILQTFALAGARLYGVPVDREGMRVDLLEGILERRKVRLIVVQPTFQNPTGSIMSRARREHLLVLARRYCVPVLEDDCYGQLAFGDPSPGPLKQLDRHGSVIYLASFSKTISPALRIGWMAAPEAVINRLAVAKQFSDLTSNGLAQLIVADLLASGAYSEHVRAVSAEYRTRRDALLASLAGLRDRLLPLAVPSGGCHVWCRLRGGAPARLLAAAALRHDVAVIAGEAFYPLTSVRGEAGQDRLRLSFPGVPPALIPAGVERLRMALEEVPAVAGVVGATDVIV